MTKREVRITPSILNADLSDISGEIGKISQVSDFIHLDVMDNIFVPNFTFDFGSATKIIQGSPIPVDAHLMAVNVEELAPLYAQVGSASVTIHAEATSNILSTLKDIRLEGARAGLALKPNTSIEDYLDLLPHVDMFLIMTVEPGFGGQRFMEDMLPKIVRTREIIGDRPIWLQVDGGISALTIEMAANAGADTFVAGSAVFQSDDPAAMVKKLRLLANSREI